MPNTPHDDNHAAAKDRVLTSAASGVYIRHPDASGRVLLVHHVRAGTWVLPGGKAEQESPRACALREGREELGVPVTVGRLLVTHYVTGRHELWPGARNIPGAYPCHLYTWQASIPVGRIEEIAVPAGELHDYGWFDVEEVTSEPGRMEFSNAANLLAAHRAHLTGTHAYLEDAVEF
ncbi:NUDIX domain-containing protein [Kitasatospora aburaviensis]|uniref:NUDIX domain-containing protein n=1 Tax=Kitasatospora aburaviensis TaxID=67265 RepID=A0ABW1EYQ4_9ACTN